MTSHPITATVRAIDAALDESRDAGTWSLDTATIASLTTDLARLTARLAELEARVLAEAITQDVPATIGARNPAAWLARHTTVTRSEAYRKMRLARQLSCDYGGRRGVRDALARGEVHPEQASVIVAAVTDLDDADAAMRDMAEKHLLVEAAHYDAQALRRLGHRILEVVDPARADAHEARLLEAQEARAAGKTRLSMVDDGQGVTRGSFAIPTPVASILRRILAAFAAPKHIRATQGAGAYDPVKPTPAKLGEAFCELIERYPLERAPDLGGMNPTVVVTVDISVLLGAYRAAHLDTGEAISPGLVRRWACQAGIVPAVMDGPSHVLDLARKTRFHTPAQRLAAGIEQQHCQHPSCDVPAAFCHLHHGIPWSRGGHTNTKDAQLLCPYHHQRAHTDIEGPPRRC